MWRELLLLLSHRQLLSLVLGLQLNIGALLRPKSTSRTTKTTANDTTHSK